MLVEQDKNWDLLMSSLPVFVSVCLFAFDLRMSKTVFAYLLVCLGVKGWKNVEGQRGNMRRTLMHMH